VAAVALGAKGVNRAGQKQTITTAPNWKMSNFAEDPPLEGSSPFFAESMTKKDHIAEDQLSRKQFNADLRNCLV
jgi:hypothetical protein